MKQITGQEEQCRLQRDQIEEFIRNQIRKRKLDGRTIKAYQLDLEHLYQWLNESGKDNLDGNIVEEYLRYLINEKKLRTSTITRKYRVFCCYMEYLFLKGICLTYPNITFPILKVEEKKSDNTLSKAEIDAFFIALNKEYQNLDTDFRRRVCLRDNVMMELLFYHGLEISELLRAQISDYDRKTETLVIQGKRKGKKIVRLFSRSLKEKMENWLDVHAYFETEEEYQNYLFISKIGRPLSMKMVINIFDKYRILAGIDKESTPKDLKCSMRRYAHELVIERCS